MIMKLTLLHVAMIALVLLPHLALSDIVITPEEKICLDETGKMFEGNNALIAARHNYAESMEMDMTSLSTMTASYPDDLLNAYKAKCTANGGEMHIVKIDFFDCQLKKMNREVELTLKNFANCLAAVPDCATFDQENLLEEAWEEMGLHCELEDEPGNASANDDDAGATPYFNEDDDGDAPPHGEGMDDDQYTNLDDDLAKKEEADAKKGAAQDAENKEYVPKEAAAQQQQTKKKKGHFWTFVLLVAVGGTVYYLHKEGRLRRFRGQLPWGGVTTSRFARGPGGGGGGGNSGLSTSYNLVSADEEFNFVPSLASNELQLSSNLTA